MMPELNGNPFSPAVREQTYLRMALTGLPGSGKTLTALKIAYGLAKRTNGKIALVDSEFGSAAKYAPIDAATPPDNVTTFAFDHLILKTYDPRDYIRYIQLAEEYGYAVLILDTISKAWTGKGGALELVDQLASQAAEQYSRRQNNFSDGWGQYATIHNDFIDAMNACKLHLIVTMRSKVTYAQEKEGDSKTKIRKLGVEPIQRANIEYEFDILGDMVDAAMHIGEKCRCPVLRKTVTPEPGADLADAIWDWLRTGHAPWDREARLKDLGQLRERMRALGATPHPFTRSQLNALTRAQIEEEIDRTASEVHRLEGLPADAPAPAPPASPPAGETAPVAPAAAAEEASDSIFDPPAPPAPDTASAPPPARAPEPPRRTEPMSRAQHAKLEQLYHERFGGSPDEVEEGLNAIFEAAFEHPMSDATLAEASKIISQMIAQKTGIMR